MSIKFIIIIRRLYTQRLYFFFALFLLKIHIKNDNLFLDFNNYFENLKPKTNNRNPWFEEFWGEQFNW